MLPAPTRPRLSSGIPFLGMALVGILPSPLKKYYYRSRGATIGKGVKLGLFSYIASPSITLEDGASIAPFTFIRTREFCRLGARASIHSFTAIDTGALELGSDSAIGEQVVVGGLLTPRSHLIIGARSKIFSYSFINPTEKITIGDEVCIGGGTYLFTHGTWQSMLDGFPGKFAPVTIESGAWLGWRCFVMPGVTVGEQATVGAQSVITKSIPARSMAVGSPASVVKQGDHIKSLTDAEKETYLQQWLQEFTDYLAYIGRTERWQNIVISLKPIPQTLREEYNAQTTPWFDIASKQCHLTDHPLCRELRIFLTRYGLRFSVL